MKIIDGGIYTTDIRIFGKNMVKNDVYDSFESDSSYRWKKWYKSQMLVKYIIYFVKYIFSVDNNKNKGPSVNYFNLYIFW